VGGDIILKTLPDSSHTLPFVDKIEELNDVDLQFEEGREIIEAGPPLKSAPPIDVTEFRVEAAQNPNSFFYRVGQPFRRAFSAIKEWGGLQRNIRTVSASIQKKEWDVLESINNYRMLLSGVTFKPVKLDQEIWEAQEQIKSSLPGLKKKTALRPLFLRKLQSLRELSTEWETLQIQQANLLDTLAKAPKSVEFYNRINFARIKKREQELRDAEVAKRNAEAKESIEKALAQLGSVFNPTDQNNLGSSVLKLDDAKNYWATRLAEVSNLEIASSIDADEVISIYRNMESTILDAPRMAEQVKEVEVQFMRMVTMHEELSGYGKMIIPADDLGRMYMVVHNEIPSLWAMGNWDKLRWSLKEVASFIKFYEIPVRSELSMAERRKPSLARAIIAGTSSLPINQVTAIVRGLVSAIDSRDRFMRGHSDAVARIAIQVAKRMNWNPDDIEYLEIAALLHDVGKVVIPENVLTKTGALSPEDWKTIQMHPSAGAQIVRNIEPLNKIAPWIYHHQERWDGSGYPDRIGDKSIPIAARIIAVGEAFTAMTSSSPQRKALSMDEAVKEITRGSGTQFDPDVAGALVQTVETTDGKFLLPGQHG